MTTCENPRCNKPLPPEKPGRKGPPRRFCDDRCANNAYYLENSEKRIRQQREYNFRKGVQPNTRRDALSWPERRAAIVAKFGVKGMGISPNPRTHAIKAERF